MLVKANLVGSEESEIYSLHAFAYQHRLDEDTSNALVRGEVSWEATEYLNNMRVESRKKHLS